MGNSAVPEDVKEFHTAGQQWLPRKKVILGKLIVLDMRITHGWKKTGF